MLHGARRTGLSAGHTVLVLGCGAVGLLACATAHLYGASHVTAVDIDPLRCEFAKKEGFADEVLTLPRLPKPETQEAGLKNGEATAKEVIQKCSPNGEGYDIVSAFRSPASLLLTSTAPRCLNVPVLSLALCSPLTYAV